MSRKMSSRRILVLALGLVVLLGCGAALAQDQTGETDPVPAVQIAFGTGVDRATRSLEDESAEFAAEGFSAEEGSVFCLTRLANMAAPTTVTHVWYHEGKTMARVELNVGGATWRTWSSKRILPAWTGQWEVKVLDADGMVLASAGFTVK